METIEVLAHVITRLGMMAVIAILGALLLAPVLGRWKWLVGEHRDDEAFYEMLRADVAANTAKRPRPTGVFNCDGCEIEYDIKGSCEYRTYDEDGIKQDYLICQACMNEIFDSWA